MINLKRTSCYALASAVVLGVAACSTGETSPTGLRAPTSPRYVVGPVPDQTAVVCKVGPVGTYDFSASNSGGANTGDVFLGTSFSLTVTDAAVPACVTVFTRVNGDNISDAPAAIAVTELAHAGTSLQSVVDSGGAVAGIISGATATVYVNGFHSAKVTYTNIADAVGCTYTQGWYKNHTTQWPTGFSPNDIFDGGLSWIDLYNTPPKKGNAYIQLAHQYMTALMNVANGASVPASVQTALDAAAAYFAAGGDNAGSGDITGVASILDAYNNGLAAGGPAHCSDEVIVH
jgi:hypothetical protein